MSWNLTSLYVATSYFFWFNFQCYVVSNCMRAYGLVRFSHKIYWVRVWKWSFFGLPCSAATNTARYCSDTLLKKKIIGAANCPHILLNKLCFVATNTSVKLNDILWKTSSGVTYIILLSHLNYTLLVVCWPPNYMLSNIFIYRKLNPSAISATLKEPFLFSPPSLKCRIGCSWTEAVTS